MKFVQTDEVLKYTYYKYWLIKKSVSAQGTNIGQGFINTYIYVWYKPRKISILSQNFAEQVIDPVAR